MANEENLRPPYSSEEAREFGRKGGIASGKSKRQKRFVKETIEILLDQPIKNQEWIEALKIAGVTDNPKFKDYLVMKILTKTANEGSMQDLVRLADLLGESPDFNRDMLEEIREILDAVPSVID